MTDSPTPAGPGPVDPDVELASALLDGEAGPDERGRAQDPAVSAHLAAFGDVADEVRAVPPAPTGLLDDQVARAMASFDEGGTVAPIGRARTETPWWQRIPLGAVAAALVVVALVGALSLAGGGADEDDTATAALDSAGDEGDDTTSGAGGDDATSGAGGGSGGSEESFSATMEDSAPMEAGPATGAGGATAGRLVFADYEQLATGIRDELAAAPVPEAAPDDTESATTERAADPELGSDESDPCGAVEQLGLDPARVVLVRSVVVTPDRVTVVVHDAEDGRRLAVVDEASCTVVLDRVL